MKYAFSFLLPVLICLFLHRDTGAQQVPPEQVIFYTTEWEGERNADGRPRVSDDLLERMRHVALEEAWGTIRGQGYHNKFEGEWQIMYPDQPIVGRALTATYMPASPDLMDRMLERGREEGQVGDMNFWPINMLEEGDVYVADSFGKMKEGTLIGDNLGQAIYANSGNGVVFYGSARDLAGLREIEGFNAFVKGWHPSYLQEVMLTGINGPTRIGEAIALPGDVVLAVEGGVLFIPPHLAEMVIIDSEVARLTDAFRRERIEEGRYALGEVYGVQWTDTIDSDYFDWVESGRTRLHEEYGVGYETIDQLIETRSRNWRQW